MRFCTELDNLPLDPLAATPPGDLRDRIAELEEQLERTERLTTLGAMSGAVAHEFNNILTPLLSYAGLALANLDDRALVQRALEKTLQGAERARQVADALLGGLGAAAAEDGCLIRDAVQSSLASLVRSPETEGIEVIVDVPPLLRVAMRPAALQQVVLNLILNACDAMRPGPGTLAITAVDHNQTWKGVQIPYNEPKQQSAPDVLVRVVDTGPGIEESLRPRIFEPLVTTKARSGAQQEGGSGLGLTVCRRLVEQAGGTITVRSQPGVGSVFAIRLPAWSPDASAQSDCTVTKVA